MGSSSAQLVQQGGPEFHTWPRPAHIEDMSNQNRVPKGVPTGGQFSESRKGEAETSPMSQTRQSQARNSQPYFNVFQAYPIKDRTVFFNTEDTDHWDERKTQDYLSHTAASHDDIVALTRAHNCLTDIRYYDEDRFCSESAVYSDHGPSLIDGSYNVTANDWYSAGLEDDMLQYEEIRENVLSTYPDLELPKPNILLDSQNPTNSAEECFDLHDHVISDEYDVLKSALTKRMNRHLDDINTLSTDTSIDDVLTAKRGQEASSNDFKGAREHATDNN